MILCQLAAARNEDTVWIIFKYFFLYFYFALGIDGENDLKALPEILSDYFIPAEKNAARPDQLPKTQAELVKLADQLVRERKQFLNLLKLQWSKLFISDSKSNLQMSPIYLFFYLFSQASCIMTNTKLGLHEEVGNVMTLQYLWDFSLF